MRTTAIMMWTTSLGALTRRNSRASPGVGEAERPGERQPGETDPTLRDIERERQKKLNTERHQSLKRDTDRLLQLANELKQSVDKSNEHMLSMDVIKKANEIEKLA